MSLIADSVSEELSFDISGALQGIGSISDALDQVVQTFQVGLADALSTLTNVGADVTPLADSLDVAGLGPAVDTALADATSAPLDVTLDADAAPLVDGIDAAIVPQTVPVEADTTSANQAIDGLDSTPITLEVDADTTAAQEGIDALGQSATKASGNGGEGLAGLEGAVVGIEAASGAAQGEVGGLTGAVGGLSAGLGRAVGAGAAFGAFIGETTKLAADAEAQNKRFAATFGDLAEQVDKIHVGGLNTTIEELGKTSGTTDADLKAVASRIGALGQSAGASNETIVKTTDNLLALGATFSVNNPRLGDAASVTDRLTNAFARGGRALAPFGLALSAAQINAEALAETGKSSAADLTLFEKSTAGANLAVKIFGDTLGTRFQQGAQSAQVQLRALKVSVEETLVAIGKPLLGPLVESLSNLLPIAQQVGLVLGALAADVLPLVAALTSGLSPLSAVLGLVADGLHLIGPGGVAAAAALAILVPDLVLVSAGFSSATVTATAFGVALDVATGPIGIAVGALVAIGLAARAAGAASKEAALDTSTLDNAFSSSGDGAKSFADSISGLNSSIDAYLGKQLQVEKDNTTGAQTLATLGFSYTDLQAAIGGTSDQYDTFLARLDQAAAASGITGKAHDDLFKIVNDGAGSLDTAAANTVALAEASGLVTEAQVKAAQAQDPLNGFTDDYGVSLRNNIGVLERLQPIIDANTAATNANSLAAAQATPAYASLVQQLGSGAITVDQFSTALQGLGVAAPAASAFATQLNTDITSMVSTIEAGLPKVADAFNGITAASDPTQLAANLQKQTDQINAFLLTIEVLRSQGHEKLATFFAEQGVGSLTQAAQAAGSTAVAATDAAALQQNEAAHKAADKTGVELVAGAKISGDAAGKAIVKGITDALDGDTSAPGTAKKKGQETGDAFKPDLAKGTKAGIAAATTTLVGAAIGLTIGANQVGNAIGESFDTGFAQGINANTPAIASAATAAANAAERAAKDALKVKSPSLVAKQIGSDFTTGLALGIVDQAPQAADASTVLANAVVKQLQAALAAATASSTSAAQTAAQSAFTSFVSGAVNSLPTVGSDISTFASNILSTTQAQNAAFKDYKKALAEQRGDQGTVQKLQTQTAAAYGTLTVAMQHYNALAASEPKKATDAQKKALAEAKSALSDAQSTFDSLARHLDSANSKLKDAAANLAHVEDVFGKATAAQDKANDPATFTKGLRAQTAAANQFARDIAKLSREGFTDLAKQLADAGPDAAGELARGFAKSPAKAKSAEAAVDAAGTFATSYQAELARLFGPQGGAADAAHTAGTTIGQALTTGLQVSSQAGTAAALANLSAQIAGAQVLPLVTTPQVQKALTPVAANAPTVIQTPTLAGQVGSQSLELDLTIVLDDGRTVTAQTSVPFTPAPTRSLKQLVRAQVHAS